MGKLKGKVKTAGNMGMLVYKDDAGVKHEYQYEQAYSKELGITLNTKVSFELVKGPSGEVAIAVCPINKAEVTSVNYETNSGTVTESESGIKYAFTQPYLREQGIAVGSVVNYTLVNVREVLQAACITLAGE